MLKKITFFLPIVAALLLWGFFYNYEQKHFEKNVRYPCVSYAPYNIVQKERYEAKELRKDILKIQKISTCVRIYGVTNGLEQVPAIAEELGMEVIIGAWLDSNPEKNELELANLISLAQRQKNIKYIVVGNETILMGRVNSKYLFEKLDLVRNLVTQPVTTTEPTEIWEVYPDMEKHVDFIGVHKFPFWEETNFEDAQQSMVNVIEDLKQIFTKPIVVLEIGWPTNGFDEGDAEPGLIKQKKYLKDTGEYLTSEGIFYNVAEGIDVPSKLKTTEGLIGLHWGILTYTGAEKHIFSFKSLIAFICLYMLLFFIVYQYNKPILAAFKEKIRSTEYIFILLSVGIATMLVFFYELYMTVMPIFQICFTLLAIYSCFETGQKYVHYKYSKLAREKMLQQGVEKNQSRFVSILVAAKDESSDQIIETLNSLIAQTHTYTEVLYIDNNSKNKNSFKNVVEYFTQNPSEKLKLFYEEKIGGFKAGALNYLLKKVNQKTDFIAVIDSDYIVDPRWIETALTYVKQDTGFVQFPQAYTLSESAFKKKNVIEIGSTIEQSYVFDVVYPVRSFIGDVVQNGTMVMIAKKYVAEGWPTYSICEDAALGLEISKQGGKSVFVPLVMGKGSAPKTFSALRKQRNRWVFGAIQILQRGIFQPKKTLSKTYFLFLLDWLGWIMQGLYPILLISSIGYIVFLWLVYLHLQISWVMLIGFLSVSLSLILFIATYYQTYKGSKHMLREIYSLLLIEFSLVNTISKTILSGFIFKKANFVTTRQIGSVRLYDLIALSISTIIVWIGLFLYIVLLTIYIPLSIRFLGFAQLTVVMLPQFAYVWLRYRY